MCARATLCAAKRSFAKIIGVTNEEWQKKQERRRLNQIEFCEYQINFYKRQCQWCKEDGRDFAKHLERIKLYMDRKNGLQGTKAE